MPSTVVDAARRARWMGAEEPPGNARAALHDLAEQARRLAATLVRVDAEECDARRLAALRARLAEVTEEVAELPDIGSTVTPAAAPGPAGRLLERSPVGGRANPVSAPLSYTFDGEHTRAHAVFGEQHEGPTGHAHGGVVAAAFDELLGIAQMAAGVAGQTVALTVRYLRPTPLRTPITFEARVDEVTGRRTRLSATCTAGERLLARAEGTFVVQQRLGADADA